MTLGDVIEHLFTISTLKPSERTTMVSAIKRFADISTSSPAEIRDGV